MKAIICEKYGPPEILQFKVVNKPIPKNNEILIKVKATTITPADYRKRGFIVPKYFKPLAKLAWGFNSPRNPILGTEFAGEVVELGKQVKNFKVGDKVFGQDIDKMGAHAEYVSRKSKGCVALKSDKLSFEQATALPFGANTALYFLKKALIKKDQKILINGASGSVGTYAVQLAKYFGANVTAVCSTKNIEFVKSLGADTVIDYTQEDFTKNGEVYDIIFDTVSKLSFMNSIHSLKKGGYFLDTVLAFSVFVGLYYFIRTGRNVIGGSGPEKGKNLKFLNKLVETDCLKPIIDKKYSFEQIVEAYRYVEKGHKRGNVVITI